MSKNNNGNNQEKVTYEVIIKRANDKIETKKDFKSFVDAFRAIRTVIESFFTKMAHETGNEKVPFFDQASSIEHNSWIVRISPTSRLPMRFFDAQKVARKIFLLVPDRENEGWDIIKPKSKTQLAENSEDIVKQAFVKYAKNDLKDHEDRLVRSLDSILKAARNTNCPKYLLIRFDKIAQNIQSTFQDISAKMVEVLDKE